MTVIIGVKGRQSTAMATGMQEKIEQHVSGSIDVETVTDGKIPSIVTIVSQAIFHLLEVNNQANSEESRDEIAEKDASDIT